MSLIKQTKAVVSLLLGKNPENLNTEKTSVSIISGCLKPAFLCILETTNLYKGLPFTWNNKEDVLIKCKSKKLYFVKLRILIALVLFGIVIFQTFTFWAKSYLFEKVYLTLLLSLYSAGVVCFYINLRHMNLLCSLINSMVNFEKSWNQVGTPKQKRLQEKFSTVKLLSLVIVGLSLLVLTAVPYNSQIFIYPCLPTYIGYKFLDECSTSNDSAIEIKSIFYQVERKLGIILVQLQLWPVALEHLSFHLSLMVIFGFAFRTYIQSYCG